MWSRDTFRQTLTFVTVFHEWFRKVWPQCNTVVHVMDDVLLLGSLRKQWNVEKPKCLRKSYNLKTKSAKWVTKLLKQVSRLCTGKNRTEHIMISTNTCHIACAEGSAVHYYSYIFACDQAHHATVCVVTVFKDSHFFHQIFYVPFLCNTCCVTQSLEWRYVA